jgi:cation transport ATPase
MTINENQEFEAINQKTKERNENAMEEFHSTEEIYRAKRVKTKRRAIVCIIVTISILLVAAAGIFALEYIGWINTTFKIVLLCLAGSWAMFKTGYFWREISK